MSARKEPRKYQVTALVGMSTLVVAINTAVDIEPIDKSSIPQYRLLWDAAIRLRDRINKNKELRECLESIDAQIPPRK
jgi:hypothetical protein